MVDNLNSPVAEKLRKLRERAGLSMDRLARACGYKGASSYQRYENATQYTKPLLPVPLAAKIAKTLAGKGDPPITLEEVLALAGVRPSEDLRLDASGGAYTLTGTNADLLGQPDIDLGKTTNLPGSNTLLRDMPVYGVAVGGTEGEFSFNGSVVDYVRRPPSLMKLRNAFAVYVSGDSMSPRFDHGDLIFVHPGRPPQPGNDVIVELHGEHGAPGSCYLKRLVRRTKGKVILAQFNPPRDDITIESDRIKAIYRILTAAEILGV
jgi:phage repressor protein C with HTH and peptisase S24 domain